MRNSYPGLKKKMYFKQIPLSSSARAHDAYVVRLTRIILFVKTVRTPDYNIPRSPREFLYVRTIIRQRYRTAVVLFLSRWYVRNWIEVLQWKKSSIEILHVLPRIFSRCRCNIVYIDIRFVRVYFNRLLDISYLIFFR